MTTIKYPINKALGASDVKAFPKTQYDKVKEIIDNVNSTTKYADIVSESTSAAGVTVDGVLLKDSKVTASGGISKGSVNITEFTTEVALTAANLIAMYTTPIVVVAAPTSDYALDFVGAVLIYDSTATAFTSGGAITIGYAGAAAVSTTLAATFLTGAGDKVWNLQKLNGATGYSMPVGTALAITNATGVFATGTGVCRLQITYRVHTTGL